MRHFIFDVDGVVIQAPLFTENLFKQYNVPLEKSISFIHGEFQKCVVGKKDLKLILPKYLAEWDLSVTVDEVLKFWFEAENKPNEKLISYIQSLRDAGHMCSVATNQEKYRIEFMRKNMNFDKYFDRVFVSCEIGKKKPDGDYYRSITHQLDTEVDNITFFDDRANYAEAAKGIGWDAYLFESTEGAIEIIEARKNT